MCPLLDHGCMNRAEIIIGRGVQSDHVMIRVLGRMHPGCTDFWDGNRLISPVRVQVGGFIAEIAAGLRTEELHSFRAGLERIYAEVKGGPSFPPVSIGWNSPLNVAPQVLC